MERIELFDSYIKDQLSEAERLEFEARLKSDEDFASEFNVYLLTVVGICREAEQDNLDLGIAMKRLTKEQLREIIGKETSNDSALPSVASTPKAPNAGKKRIFRVGSWIWQATSIAAVVIIAFTAVLRIEKNAQYAVDNAIYASADITPDLSRNGSETIDVASFTDEELKSKLPSLEKYYQTADNPDEIADNGYVLGMVYLKLHDREKAAIILTELVDKFEDNPDFAESVNKWKSILQLIK